MGCKAVAEGVETVPELALLQKWNIDYIQGYYFSKPVSEKAIIDVLNDGNASSTAEAAGQSKQRGGGSRPKRRNFTHVKPHTCAKSRPLTRPALCSVLFISQFNSSVCRLRRAAWDASIAAFFPRGARIWVRLSPAYSTGSVHSLPPPPPPEAPPPPPPP